MEIQKQILLFFASIQTPVLDAIVQFITMFGEEYITVAIITFMYWNISKKKGFTTCMCMLSAAQVMSLTKALVRFPRPWKVIDGLSSRHGRNKRNCKPYYENFSRFRIRCNSL